MSDIYFPDRDRQVLENQAVHGVRAREVMDGADWKWLKEYIFGSMEDQATHTLINAHLPESRARASAGRISLASRTSSP